MYLWKIIDNMRYVQFEWIPDHGRINCRRREIEFRQRNIFGARTR